MKQAPAGFGLVEMLVVVAILSVLAIGTSMLTLRDGGPLNRTVGMLLTDAVETRRLAMLSGLDHALIFAPDGWQVARKSAGDWSTVSVQTTAAVTLSTTQSPWVLSADGRFGALDLRLAADGETRRCVANQGQMMRCP